MEGYLLGWISNSKHEIRNSKQAQMFQILISQTKFENLNFEIVSDFDIRISKFSDGF